MENILIVATKELKERMNIPINEISGKIKFLEIQRDPFQENNKTVIQIQAKRARSALGSLTQGVINVVIPQPLVSEFLKRKGSIKNKIVVWPILANGELGPPIRNDFK